ncbi:MAG: hypothetical protein ACD_3C00125G0003 [uncultured bacterium (gcode 4)]|uniref:Caib/baif family protein n=1 Tax=uncultured bacterium (gcode 4) TaxID=1234023 RepID=K2GCE5_9BACT|nr:MAG: hypothetical protein ACD_3C00125G0003 [uncultured bacterium (gcode 4)]
MQAETTVENRICKKCSRNFSITDKDLEFYDMVSPSFPNPGSSESGLKKHLISPPTLCPSCRQQRRLTFRNERNLYKRKCDLTGKDIISIYSPDKKSIVYEESEWWSDRWNPFDYGQDFDFSRSFFSQFEDLMKAVPRMSLSNGNNEDSAYNNDTWNCKNTYLCFFSSKIENSFYINGSFAVKDSMDIGWSKDIENSYECFNCSNMFKCTVCISSDNCRDVHYSYDCNNCQDCFGCVWLKNKSFCLLNVQLEEKQYREKLEEIYKNNKISEIIWLVDNLRKRLPVKYANIENSINCIWDYIYSSNDSRFCYEIEGINKGKYLSQCSRWNDMFDCDNSWGEGWIYFEDMCVYDSFRTIFTSTSSKWSDLLYCDNCYSSSDLFWCIWLRNAKYCILNKEYSKEQYFEMVPKIIDHMKKDSEWWEFFPSSMSPFWYNETSAFEYFPIERDDAINRVATDWFNWSTYENPAPQVSKVIPASKLPDNINDIPDDILNWAVECEVTNRPFRIIKQELEFYRKHELSVPKRHPDQRHLDRMALRNPRKLHDRNCDKCSLDIVSTYDHNNPKTIYCSKCYEKEMN